MNKNHSCKLFSFKKEKRKFFRNRTICYIFYFLYAQWYYLMSHFRHIFAYFEKWLLTLKSHNSKSIAPNLENKGSKFKLDPPLSRYETFFSKYNID